MARHAQTGVGAFEALVAIVLFLAIAGWQYSRDAGVKELALGPLKVVYADAKPISTNLSLDGAWTYYAQSNVSGLSCQRNILLSLDRDVVSGLMHTCDGSDISIKGRFSENILTFSRNADTQVVQKFVLRPKTDNVLVGNFWNEGPIKDEGSIELKR